MGESIWIVFGTTGEYSDRSEWVVDAWLSEEKAQARVEYLKKLYQETGVERVRSDYGSKARDEAWEKMLQADPGFSCDYTGTDYYIAETTLKR